MAIVFPQSFSAQRLRRHHARRGIEGLFFDMPPAWQARRIRELACSQSPAFIAAGTHKSIAEVMAILKERQ
ncbi:MAG TPA: hypothetical protein VN660_01070 [Steroidobacteraceae bacterium]|nr:hypothetical protein [Steroidobacteraceae bacterium]